MKFSRDHATRQAIAAGIVAYGEPARMIALLKELARAPKSGVEVLDPELAGARHLEATPARFGAVYTLVQGQLRVSAAGPEDGAVLWEAKAAAAVERDRDSLGFLLKLVVAAELQAEADRDLDLGEAITAAGRAFLGEAADPPGDIAPIPALVSDYALIVLVAAGVRHSGVQPDQVKAQVVDRVTRIGKQIAVVDRSIDGLGLL